MKKETNKNYYVFLKKLLFIRFYNKKEMSYEDIAYMVKSKKEIVRTYCITFLNENKEKEVGWEDA